MPYPRRTPTQARSRETMEVVFEAALRELGRSGPDAVNVNRVAEVAGVSVGSLYQYFPSKDALLASLITRFVRHRFESIMAMIHAIEREERETGAVTPLAVVMKRLVEGTLGLNRKMLPIERALFAWFARVGKLEALTDIDRDFTAQMADGIRVLQATPGRVRDVSPEIAARVLLQSIRAVAVTTVLQEPALLEGDELSTELTELAVRYLAP